MDEGSNAGLPRRRKTPVLSSSQSSPPVLTMDITMMHSFLSRWRGQRNAAKVFVTVTASTLYAAQLLADVHFEG